MTDFYCDQSLIKQILPHREPFLFVDKVIAFQAGEWIVAEKSLDAEAHFFQGHFPGEPVMPGVLVAEALAQASGLLLGLAWRINRTAENFHRQNLYLASVKMKFLSPARPGDTLQLASNLQKNFGNLTLFATRATVANRPIAAGSLALGFADPSP